MSQALRKLTGASSPSRKTTLIFINQIREKIGVMFGNPETTTGGRALKFYSSVRIDIRRIERDQGGRERHRQPHAACKVVKNKVAPPFRRPSSTSSTARASRARATWSTSASSTSIVEKSGAWFTYGDDAPRPGPREREAVPPGQPRPRRRDREEDPDEPRPPRERRLRRGPGDGRDAAPLGGDKVRTGSSRNSGPRKPFRGGCVQQLHAAFADVVFRLRQRTVSPHPPSRARVLEPVHRDALPAGHERDRAGGRVPGASAAASSTRSSGWLSFLPCPSSGSRSRASPKGTI